MVARRWTGQSRNGYGTDVHHTPPAPPVNPATAAPSRAVTRTSSRARISPVDTLRQRADPDLTPLRFPRRALTITGAASIAATAAFGSERTATRATTLIIQYGAYLILAAYLLTVIAALAWTWRTRRRPLPLAVLAAGVAVLGYVLYRTFVPFPAASFGWVVAAAAVSAAAGAGFLLIPGLLARLRSSPLLAVTAAARCAQRP